MDRHCPNRRPILLAALLLLATTCAISSHAVAVYDTSGRLVRDWEASGATSAAGSLRVDWDGTDLRGHRLPAGIYFAKAGRKIVRVALLR